MDLVDQLLGSEAEDLPETSEFEVRFRDHEGNVGRFI